MKKQQIYNFTISAICALFIVSCGQSATDSNLTEDKNRTKEIDSSNINDEHWRLYFQHPIAHSEQRY